MDDITFDTQAPEDEKPWVTSEFGKWVVHTVDPVELNIGANNTIFIDKMYGPLAAAPVRITLKYEDTTPATWVVEYKNFTTDNWEVKAEWNCQENWSKGDNNG